MGALLLVRHGQASWGSDDYDVLSDHGHDQARLTGAALAHLSPVLVVHGSLRRQEATASELVAAAGWPSSQVRVDPRWDEMDHLALLAKVPTEHADPDPRQFQAWFEAATDRWLGGEHDDEYDESWPGFHGRVLAALADLAEPARAGDVVVVTSGGPISAVASDLLGGGRTAYQRIAPVVPNASITKVVSGRRGLSLVSLNEHAHLVGDALTYR